MNHFPLAAAGFDAALENGPFSFADPERIRHTLETAGFGKIMVQPFDAMVSSGDIEAMTRVLLRVGQFGKIARESPTLRLTAEPFLREALAGLTDSSNVLDCQGTSCGRGDVRGVALGLWGGEFRVMWFVMAAGWWDAKTHPTLR